jgi:uncharacterized protein YecE (DUF72 family)
VTLPLFEEQPDGLLLELRAHLRTLAEQNILIGTSSWKYEGWLGQIYSRENYLSRGKFSKKRFEAECLEEYAQTFPIVCGDFSFYQFPAPEYWHKLFSSAPPHLKFALKAPEEVTAEVFPRHARYGPRAGLRNPAFLDAGAFSALFLDPLSAYRDRISSVILEFGARNTPPAQFTRQLQPFLAALPADFRYAVEVRNPTYLNSDHFGCLREHRTAHVFNAWTRMPELAKQIAIPEALTADFTVVRALLREGRAYEDAVKMFAPYDRIQDENQAGRKALRDLMKRMKEEKRAALIFINNRFEGNAPKTIQAIAAE